MGTRNIDRLDKKILQIISQDARIPFLEVARECNVSGAAIHQRIQKLRSNGVIKGSEFVIDAYKVGYQTCAYIGVILTDIKQFKSVVEHLRAIHEIVECHYSTGKFAMFLKIYAIDNRHLLQIILDKITPIVGIAHTETFQISLDEIFHRQLSVFENATSDDYIDGEISSDTE
ncbi:MAG: AsnC family transcriptional regulator [Paludibacter sp.]|nr:AsnC family transcriptional regulator [Paludibacter sp.]